MMLGYRNPGRREFEERVVKSSNAARRPKVIRAANEETGQ